MREIEQRMPRFLNYFAQILERNGRRARGGNAISYVDLSLFQLIEGLRYTVPRAISKQQRKHPRVITLHDVVAARPRLATYLAFERFLPFYQDGIFRQYPDLDDGS